MNGEPEHMDIDLAIHVGRYMVPQLSQSVNLCELCEAELEPVATSSESRLAATLCSVCSVSGDLHTDS